MADTQISNLTNGAPLIGTEDVPLQLGAANYRATTGDIALLALQETFEGALHVNAATTAALPASTYANGVAGVGATLTKNSGNYGTIDTVTAVVGRRYLIKNQASAIQNGVYELTAANVMTRTTDSDLNTEFDAQVVIVGGGSTNLRKVFSQTTALPVIGTSSIVYAQTAAASGIGAPVSLTRDQARAAVLASSFTPGRQYIITNAMAQVTGVTIDCKIWLIAESTNRLATRGTGLFKNSVMAAQMPMAMDYTLNVSGSDDFIAYLYQAAFNNAMYFKDNYKSIDKFYFDTGNMYNVTWLDAIATAIADTTITNSTFGYNANITISNTASCVYSDIGALAVLSLVNTSGIFKVSVGAGATLKLLGTQSLTDCKLGNGKTLDATSIDSAYSATGKVYDGDSSTFVITSTDSAAVNPVGASGEIEMVTFKWAGVLICDDNTKPIGLISNFGNDHKIKIAPTVPMIVDFVNNTGAGTCIVANTFLEVDPQTTIDAGDFMELDMYPPNAAYLAVTNFFIH